MDQAATSRGVSKIYEAIARWAIYLMAGLVPLMYLPWTVDRLEVNKQTFVLILVSVSVIAWLGLMVARKQFIFRKSWLFLLAGAFLVAALLSSTFSIAPFTSWVGQSLQEYTSFLSILAFVLLFIVGGHVLSETRTQRVIWSVSLIASAIISIAVLLALLGVPLPINFIGTPNALGLYLAAMAVLGSGLYLVSANIKKHDILPGGFYGVLVRAAIFITALAALVVLIAIDYWSLWAALMVGVAVMFTFSLIRAQEFPNTSRFVLPMVLFVAAILFLFLPGFLPGRFPVEVAPSQIATWNIATETLGDTNVLFGSGPGTFVMDYTKHHVEEINQTIFWDARFDRGASHMLTMLATFGIVGTAAFLLFLFGIKVASLRMLLKERMHDEWKMTFVSFAAWFVLVFGMFVYTSNFTLQLLFWLLSAGLVSQVAPKMRVWEFARSPRLGLLTAFLFVLVNVGLLTVMFVSISRYAAEIAFARAVQSDRSGESLDEIIVDLDAAARLNRLSDIYYRNLGHALLLKTAEVLQDPAVTAEDIQGLIGASINSALRAADLSPQNVINWSLLGDVYREVAPLVGNADLEAIKAYQRTVELAPTNPKYRVLLGRAHLVRADQLVVLTTSEDAEFAAQASKERDEALAAAVDALIRATELKNDYAPAHYYLALAYERQGNLSESIARMEALRQANQLDIGLAFQLGILYLKQGKTDLAKQELERAIEIAPNFSNARWYLSAVYEQDGDFDAAIEQVLKVKELNPENSVVDQRLANLRAGKAAAELPEPLEEGEEGVTSVEEPLFEVGE